MRCCWQELQSILPLWLRRSLEPMELEPVQELRLRLHSPPEIVIGGTSRWLKETVTKDDLLTCVNTASRYSPWSAVTAARGYITAPGGHRIGLCGEAVIKDGRVTGFREITSVNIRVARDIHGISQGIDIRESLLILGPPGYGKTTLLRDLIRRIGDAGTHISVVDERRELFPGEAYPAGKGTDVLHGCSKPEGMDMLLRTMGPEWIAVDEITDAGDCEALLRTGWCGVRLLATAHAASLEDLRRRGIYRPLAACGLFATAVVLKRDKTWTQERIYQ